MSTRHRPPYHADGPFVALRQIVAGERTFERGDAFPAAELGFRPDQIFVMWAQAMIDTAPRPPAGKAKGRRSERAA